MAAGEAAFTRLGVDSMDATHGEFIALVDELNHTADAQAFADGFAGASFSVSAENARAVASFATRSVMAFSQAAASPTSKPTMSAWTWDGITDPASTKKPGAIIDQILAGVPADATAFAHKSRVRAKICTCSGRSPTSSCNSRNIACSGVSPCLIPPCGNCHEWVRSRLPQNTWLRALSRMTPTLGLKPSRSSIIKPRFLN